MCFGKCKHSKEKNPNSSSIFYPSTFWHAQPGSPMKQQFTNFETVSADLLYVPS